MTSDGASLLGGEAAHRRRRANWAAAGAVTVLGLAIAVSGSAVASALVAQNVTEDIDVPEISTVDQAPRGVIIDVTDSTTITDDSQVDATGDSVANESAGGASNGQGDEHNNVNAPVEVLPAIPAVPHSPELPAAPAKPASPADRNMPTDKDKDKGKVSQRPLGVG